MIILWKKYDGMHAFYINGMLRSLVFALVSIFTPVYLYKMGQGLWQTTAAGIVLVAAYYIFTRFVTLFSAIPISRIIEKIGFRRSIFISLFILAVNLACLLLADSRVWMVAISAIAGGINIPFYWVARSSAIAQDSSYDNVGKQMGIMTTIEQITTLLGPFVAGVIVERFGFNYLYSLALVILAISVLPLMAMPPHVHKNGASWKGFGYFLRDRRYFHIAVGVGARAVDDYAISILWPLTIFVMGIQAGALGGIFSSVALVALVVRLVGARVFDKLHSKGDYSDEFLYAISAIINSVMWILRIFVRGISSILMLDMTGAIFGTIYSSMYIDYEQLGGKRMGSIAYWVYGEMMYSIMAIALFASAIIGVYFRVWREMYMITASVWVLVSIVMARESNMGKRG